MNDKSSYERWLAVLSHIHKLPPICRLYCIAVAGASKHFTPRVSPCIEIRSHQAKSSRKLLNESVYSTRVSTLSTLYFTIFIFFIIYIIYTICKQCTSNFYIVFITDFCPCPCSARRHRSQIKPAATGHRNKESLENGKLRQVIGRALWCAKNTSTHKPQKSKKLKVPEIYLWHKHI